MERTVCLGTTDEKGWVLQREESGISVYTRNLDGSPLDEYKAMTVVYNVPIDSIYALIVADMAVDCPRKTRW